MPGRYELRPEVQEQLRLAKELQESYKSRVLGDTLGHGAHGSRGAYRGNISDRGERSLHDAASATTYTSGFSPSHHTSRQGIGKSSPGNGGFSLGAVLSTPSYSQNSAITTASRDHPAKGVIQPHMRPALQMTAASRSSNAARNQELNRLRDITNHRKPEENGPGGNGGPNKRIKVDSTLDHAKQDINAHQPAQSRNVLSPGTDQMVTKVDGSQAKAPGSVPSVSGLRRLHATFPVTVHLPGPVANSHHQSASTASNSSDVEMTGVESDGYEKSRPLARKHGGIFESSWAGSTRQHSATASRVPSDPFENRWIPTRVSDPTPAPSHLLPLLQSRRYETTRILAHTSTSTSAPGSRSIKVQGQHSDGIGAIGAGSLDGERGESQRVGTSTPAPTTIRRGGGRGGLGGSRWA